MAEYRQYCPVARACEILADRWTPLIVRELLAGSRHFNQIERGLPGISRSLLVARLRHLEDAGSSWTARAHLPATCRDGSCGARWPASSAASASEASIPHGRDDGSSSWSPAREE